ncbi:MAG TPA: TonB-dependent receptor [Flavobacteriales bacterium]|nr:TonB-dependent receptor [Flavobacteriales bacterium]
MRFIVLSFFLVCSVAAMAQTTVRGRVVDGESGEPVFSANVILEGTINGVTTDFDGQFLLPIAGYPAVLQVSFIGYAVERVNVQGPSDVITVRLQPDQVLIEAAEVIGERISEKQKQAPLTVESMDVIAIKEAPSGSFYEGLGNLKGVDVTSASLGFKIINTRGFNSTSPVRSLQLIDGIDNQSPGLNFSLGNFLGASDLDVKSVDIVAGASSAFYGPGAFNGVVSMETKSPFQFPGVNASFKIGERNLEEIAFRYADYTMNADGDPVFGLKVNAFRFSAYDWEATNYDPVDGSQVDASNPGRFDAVNIYGDEYKPVYDFSGDGSSNARGLGNFFRTGYREKDLVDYNTENLKVSTAAHWRLRPEQTYESPELIYGFNSGFGTTVYQGDNRFSLRDIEFYQHKLELRKPGKWFVRAYRTSEDAGNSYDPYATALKLQETTRDDYQYSKVYYKYWTDSIAPVIGGSYPQGILDMTTDPISFYYEDGQGMEDPTNKDRTVWEGKPISVWYSQMQDSLYSWHSQVEAWANAGYAGLQDVSENPVGYLQPGSAAFDAAFNQLVSAKNNEGEGGTRFFDQSSLSHVHGEYIFNPSGLEEVRVGGNFRRYTPYSDGTIFSDTTEKIVNQEIGFYSGVKKRFLEDRMIVTGTVRADKNQNFKWVVSPAASLVFSPREKDYLRMSFSSALRNPTLADQYLYLDVGPATLVGNLNGADSLITIGSFIDFRNSADASAGQYGLNRDTLVYFDIAPIRPEQVRTFEVGYRTTLGEKVYVDGSYYFSIYQHFIGYNIGLDALFIGNEQSPRAVDVYRYAANSISEVQTQGAAIGINYYIDNNFMVAGNYSWNELVKTDEDDPIIPAFNTPRHKYNLSISARSLKLKLRTYLIRDMTWGFSANYKWVEGFIFEGSPQFTGAVPTFNLLDAQVNAVIPSLNTTIKLGGSNVLNNLHIEAYGGPYVGRMLYASLIYDFSDKASNKR